MTISPNSKIELAKTDTSAKARNLKQAAKLLEEHQAKGKKYADEIKKLDEQLETNAQKMAKALDEADSEKLMKYGAERSRLMETRKAFENAMQEIMNRAPAEAEQARKMFAEVRDEGHSKLTQLSEKIRQLVFEAKELETEMWKTVQDYNKALADIKELSTEAGGQMLEFGMYANVNKRANEYSMLHALDR